MSSEQHAGPPEPTTPDEISRTRFMAQATVALGSLVGIAVAVPAVATLVPKEELVSANQSYTPISKEDFDKLAATTDKPVKIFFKKKVTDAYFETEDEYYVWGVKLGPGEEQQFRNDRPDLFDAGKGDITYDVINMGFVVFSSICPHLGCKPDWHDDVKQFICPCHKSNFNKFGKHLEIGPAPRGLDPLPFREKNGTAEVEWIAFKANEPAHVIISYT